MIRSAVAAVLTIPILTCAIDLAGAQDAGLGKTQELQPFVGAQPPSFSTVEELAEEFRQALGAGDKEKLATLLGLAPAEVVKSREIDGSVTEIREAAAQSIEIEETAPDRRLLLLGDLGWPFPFPVVETGGKWTFDTLSGLEEVVNRRIGENELTAIANMRAYFNAQEQYHGADWDEDGVAEYAQRLISTPGTYDGLYWEPGDGVPDSPVGAEVDQAELAVAAEDGYFGYRNRVLSRQGPNIAGGQYDYVVNGNMIGGFGLIATPAEYDRTGVMTFVVNQYGTVYEKDLGPDSAEMAAKITSFDPDDSWKVVNDPGD
ncbi:DUF2950 family protein [Mesorhizobium sp. WSM2561]|uniref:DUF2950 family protein n=1 Tax=Mesorhizobium sp. WSM2561 TaxID=1040985 RepID=UPI00047F6E7B|nr:DUF2950 family protein [Mesorhizobium sp. WSM2561]